MLEDKESHVSPSPTHSSTALPCLLPYVDFSPDLLRSFRHFFSDINFVFFKCKIGAQLSPSYWDQAVISCSEMSASYTLGRNTSYWSTGPELLEEWVRRFSEAGARQELPLRWLLVLLSPSHLAHWCRVCIWCVYSCGREAPGIECFCCMPCFQMTCACKISVCSLNFKKHMFLEMLLKTGSIT